jgi:DNA-binding SARP family transcriptional activator
VLRLRLLGTLEVSVDGRTVAAPDGRPARALLAWLSLHPGAHSRDAVAEALWPGGLRKAQRDSLKTALAKLRRALPAHAVARCFVIGRTQLGIREEMVSTDVVEMSTALEAGDREAALELARGDLLPELEMDWLDDLRAAHHLQETSLLAGLAEDAARVGDRPRAVELARRRSRCDPLDEEAAMVLMELLLGERKERTALEEYERLVRAHRRAGLAYQPGVAMLQLTTTLHGRLGAGRRFTAARLPGGDELPDPLHAFRWDAYLRPPDREDPHPDFAIESIRIAFRAARLPDRLRVTCRSAESEDPLASITAAAGDWFRWTVDPGLDPADDRVFAVDALLVDGVSIPCAATEPVSGADGVAHVFEMPGGDELGLHSVDLLARSRVFVGSDLRIRSQAVTHRPVTDAEFRLTVSETLPVRTISVGTAQVTPLAGEGTPICGPLFAPVGGAGGALARFCYPLQQGSGVTFEIVRDSERLHPPPLAMPAVAHR